MTIWIFILLFTIGYWLYYHFTKHIQYFEDHGIPYLPGWPLIGNMAPILFRRKHMSEITKDIYSVDSNAKYVGAFNLTNPTIVLRDLDLIKSITIQNFDSFQDHKSFFDLSYDPCMSGSLFNLVGETWREARDVLSPTFTSKKIKAMYEMMVNCAHQFVNYIEEETEQSRKIMNIMDLITKYTNDVIATCAFGISVDSFKEPKNYFYVYGKEFVNMEGIKMIKLLFTSNFPKLTEILKVQFVNDQVGDYFKNIISQIVQARDENEISGPDMLQLMMNARNKDYKYIKMDIKNIIAHTLLYLLASVKTTSTQICILAHELAVNPEIQKKLQAEIDEVLKESKGNPTYEAIKGMPYLDAVFNESVRFHTQAGMLDRVCTRAFEIPPALPGGKPFTIQPGMGIWIPTSAIHRDSKYYENPEKFDPERYYKKKVSINDVTNLGFGIGPRSCIATRFAILETKILIFYLLSKFNVKPNAKTCSLLKYSANSLFIKPEGGYWLSIEPRSEM